MIEGRTKMSITTESEVEQAALDILSAQGF